MVRPRCSMLMGVLGLAAATATATATAAPATQFGFSNSLTDHAVIHLPFVIWGFGNPQETVSITVSQASSKQSETTKVGADGIWRQSITELTKGFDSVSIDASSGSQTISLRDLLVGEVILCSGQSNIDTITVKHAFNATAEIAACSNFPHVRIARTQRTNEWSGPQADLLNLQLPWTAPNASNCPTFSATCFFAARNLFEALGRQVPIGVVQSAAGGTAVRNWVPASALALCSQPWSGQQHYGYGPYTHSTLFNSMIAPFGTGPTAFSFVLWDQAESDSYPQTLPGYYGCETVAHVNSWRELLQAPELPWLFVHLQPYTGSEGGASDLETSCGDLFGDPLAELRHAQLSALQLPHTGIASAIDLGDPTSPYGNVHFQNKQEVARRLLSAALDVVYGRSGGSGGAYEYPPLRFFDQVPGDNSSGCSMKIRFFKPHAKPSQHATGATGTLQATTTGYTPHYSPHYAYDPQHYTLALGATPDPGLPVNGSSAVCPAAAESAGACAGFELLCTSDEVPHNPTNPATWVAAVPTLSADGTTLTLTASKEAPAPLVARGSRYAWSQWPLATLFAAASSNGDSSSAPALGLPVLPWNQALTCHGPGYEKVGAPC